MSGSLLNHSKVSARSPPVAPRYSRIKPPVAQDRLPALGPKRAATGSRLGFGRMVSIRLTSRIGTPRRRAPTLRALPVTRLSTCKQQEAIARHLGDEMPTGRLQDRVVAARGRPLGAPSRNRIERAAPLVVATLRHLALQGEELAALGYLHEGITDLFRCTERSHE